MSIRFSMPLFCALALTPACSPPDSPSFPNLAPAGGSTGAVATPEATSSSIETGAKFSVQDSHAPKLLDRNSPAKRLLTDEQGLLLRSARNSVALENWGEGLSLFESYLLQVPGDNEVRMEYAGLLVQEGQLAKARDAYEEVRISIPNDLVLRRRLANVLIIAGEYWAAMDELEAVVSGEPDDITSAAMLARVYAWVKDFERAQQVYDRYLRKLNPADEDDQLLLAPVLLDMQRPGEALVYLERLHRRYPQEIEWTTHLVLCYLQTGASKRAIQLTQSMAELEPEAIQARIQLVDQLLQLNNYKLAMEVNRQVLSVAPNDAMARLMAARILLEAYDVNAASDALDRLRPVLGRLRAYEMAQARYHHLVGQWVDAQGIYESLLVHTPDDHEVRLLLAMLRREKGDMEHAKSDLRRIPMESPLGPRARVELANTLLFQGRYEDAASTCQSVLAQRPNYLEAVLGLVRAQLKLEAFNQARSTCQLFIDSHGSDQLAVAQVKLALARTHLLSGNAILASRTYRDALDSPLTHTPEAFYGLASARRSGGSRNSAHVASISSAVHSTGEDIRLRIELAALALGDHNWERAQSDLRSVLQWQPDNSIALVLLGESENQRLKSGEKADPVRVFSSVLVRDPNNSRARLGIARAFVILRRFEDAVAEYDQLIAQDSTYTYVKRERARVLYWDRKYEASFKAYNALLAQLPKENYPVDFLASASTDGGSLIGLDFEAEFEVAEGLRLERDLKINMGWRPTVAIKALERLSVLEPANLEARFDLAQLYHRSGRTVLATEHYQDLIKETSGHREAEVALNGVRLLQQPRLNLDVISEERNGRDGLAVITEKITIGEVLFPMGDAEDYFGVGLGLRKYELEDVPDLSANTLRLTGSKLVGTRTAVHGIVEIPHYDTDTYFDERILFNVGVRHKTDEELGIDVSIFAKNVAENSETLIRDLHSQGARMGLTKKHSRKVDFGASVLFADYSDKNARFEMNLFAAYEFQPAPSSLRLLAKIDMLDYSKENELVGDTDNLSGLIIPYFAPSGYSIFSTQMDWRHQFGEEWFTGSPDMWYGVSGRLALDNNGAGYTQMGVTAGYDFSDWLGLNIGTAVLRSSEIDVTTSQALVTVRWP